MTISFWLFIFGAFIVVSSTNTCSSSKPSAPYKFNKGTAFTEEERTNYGLHGLLPPRVETIEEQAERVFLQLDACNSPIEKYNLLTQIRQTNQILFYYLVSRNIRKIAPIIYTPTVGKACQEYGQHYKEPEGLFLNPDFKGHIRQVLDNWKPDVNIIVVSDGSRILGLGDLGLGGMGIPMGKLHLYVAAGGFDPSTVLPIILDTGTNTNKYIEDKFYLGKRYPRIPDSEYYPFLEEFLMAVKDKWPHALLQFEDFSNDHCFDLLEIYAPRLRCFNDDIQGTGAVIAAGFINAIRVTKVPASQHRIVFLGAGSAGIGVADQIVEIMVAEEGVTHAEARKRFYFVDSDGLITSKRTKNKFASHKLPYVRDDAPAKELIDVIKSVSPTALIGLSGQGGSFTEEIIKKMAELNERPVIFTLSNPTTKSECTAEQAYTLTDGKVVFASGSPFDPITLPDGRHFIPGQGNNMYIFPGLGFGAWLCQSTKVSTGMITAAAQALAEEVSDEGISAGNIYPPLEGIRDISARIATRVIETAFKEGLAGIERPDNILKYVQEAMFPLTY